VDNTQEQRVISFCTGYGGIELGLKRVIPNMRTIAYVEIEAFAVANLVAKIEEGKLDAAPVWTNLKTFPSEKFRGRVHGITGGYPCQPFSDAGKRQGTADPRHLWPYILEHVRTIRPVWCFFENVSGHLTLGFDEVFKSLRGLGYKIEAGLFTAAEIGAPHKRERLFIFANTNKLSSRQNTGRNGKEKKNTCENWQAVCTRQSTGTGEQLANTGGDRLQRLGPNGNRQGQAGLCDREANNQTQWPARPGQRQYDWEEPRTVESGMGRNVDGFKSRVDELRLLGNGVVPQQAEKAFKELMRLTNIKC